MRLCWQCICKNTGMLLATNASKQVLGIVMSSRHYLALGPRLKAPLSVWQPPQIHLCFKRKGKKRETFPPLLYLYLTLYSLQDRHPHPLPLLAGDLSRISSLKETEAAMESAPPPALAEAARGPQPRKPLEARPKAVPGEAWARAGLALRPAQETGPGPAPPAQVSAGRSPGK